MSSSKFADLEGVDFTSPDVYETSPPSPRRRGQGGLRHSASSDESEENSDSGSDVDFEGRNRKRTGGRQNNGRYGKKDEDKEGTDYPGIEKLHIDSDAAARRFKDATGVDTKGVDFSPAIHRRRKNAHYYPAPASTFETSTYELGSGTGYRASGQDDDPWITVSKEKEKPVDRLRRLRYEMEELERELKSERPNDIQTEERNKAEDGGEGKDGEADPAALILQLRSLRGQLSQLDDHAKESSQKGELFGRQKWEVEAKKLLASLSASKETSTAGDVDQNIHVSEKGKSPARSDGSKVAGLDQRIAGLEELVGIREASLDESKSLSRPLMPALARIEHLLTLLTQPRHLDGISRRIKVLVSELERVHEARRKLGGSGATTQLLTNPTNGDNEGKSSNGASLPPDMVAKLDSVFPLLGRLDPLMPLAPTLLSRLHSLSTLHSSAAHFAEDLSSLGYAQKKSEASHEELSLLLKNIDSSLKENEERVRVNLQSVEQRIEGLGSRLEKLRT